MTHNFDIAKNTTLMVLAGSRCYGMNTASSDVDVRGVVVAPMSVALGLYNQGFTEADGKATFQRGGGVFELLSPELQAIADASSIEGCLTEVRKFAGMAMGANPTIMDVLFCRDSEVVTVGDVGAYLRKNRNMVLSQKAMHSYTGYAAAQLKKIENHQQWIRKTMTEPTRASFGLPEKPVLNDHQLGAIEAIVKQYTSAWHIDLSFIDNKATRDMLGNMFTSTLTAIIEPYVKNDPKFVGNPHRADQVQIDAATRLIGLEDNLMEVLTAERKFREAQREYADYQSYLKSRNQSRFELESKFGFDTKHGAHLIRLLRMGKEIMTTGEVRVWREDAHELLAIRNGEWSFEKVVETAKETEAEIRALPKERMAVPYAPDKAFTKGLDDLLLERYGRQAVAKEMLAQFGIPTSMIAGPTQ